jgi:hypothetical protein
LQRLEFQPDNMGRKEKAMTTFDLADVRRFTADLNARMDKCDNGEGMECANLDGTLRHYAELCCEFCQRVRAWGRAIFYGHAALDPEVEKLWFDEGIQLYRRASELWAYGREREGECFVLEHGAALGAALWQLQRLMSTWVTPKLAIAPGARNGFGSMTQAAKEEVQKRIDALPPLPADWQPSDPRRRALFRKLQKRQQP